MKITVTEKIEKDVKYLKARCGVRYWDDAMVNGQEDTEGDLIPCRIDDNFCPIIELETGKILDWTGVIASIHYKVCDDGDYWLLDEDKNEVVKSKGEYVPSIMCPVGNGYGDYVIMKVDENGIIENWQPNLDDFEDNEDD